MIESSRLSGASPPAVHDGLGSYFVATYPPFSVWSSAGRERYREVLTGAPSQSWGLYVHVPFCIERCRYCYYLSLAQPRGRDVQDYVDGLIEEAGHYAASPRLAATAPEFVYFGGGTPSLLPTRALRRLLEGLGERLPFHDAREVSFECAPRSATRDRLGLLRDAGVTRISLGVQQLDDRVLAANGRVHREQDVARAWDRIREFDFAVTNLDLIAGLVGQSEQGFLDSLERVVAMAPSMITVYQLEVPMNTPLYRDIDAGRPVELPSLAARRRRLRLAFERLRQAGYTRISAYAAVRDPTHHRFLYQERQYGGADLVGLGASAFSYVDGVHQQNVASIGAYLDCLRDGHLPLGRAHALDAEERRVRELVLQLKLGAVERARMRARHGRDPVEAHAEVVAELASDGILEIDERRIRVTDRGLDRIDGLLERFYREEHRDLRYS